jgi:heptosyltransferase-2
VDTRASSIIVRMPNWLGDTVMALPALSALRAAHGRARITAIGRWAPLLLGQGVADLLLPYPRALGDRLVLGRSLRRDPPDLAILLVNSLESALAAWGWGASRRLGFDTDGRRPLLTEPVPLPSPRRHQIDEYVTLLATQGVGVGEDATPAWRLPGAGSLDAELEGLFEGAGVRSSARLVGLHLGAAFGPSKLWPTESFGRLAARLDRDGLSPVLLGSSDGLDAARQVRAAAGFLVPSLVGRDHPALLPRLLSRLSCLVSGDTGVAHLAAAVGVPTVTLFGPTDPRRTAPRARRARVVVRHVACAPCFLPDCPIDHICLARIEPEEVESQVKDVVAA